jgi:hypothetical protein
MPLCISCQRTFRRLGDLHSHQRQAISCKWVITVGEVLDDGPMQMLFNGSDDEEDPDLSGEDMFEDNPALDPYDNIQMGDNEPWHAEPPLAQPPNIDPSLHDAAHRATVEDNLDDEPLIVKVFRGAGDILSYAPDGRTAYAARTIHSANPYYPFVSRIDWDVAKWAKQQGPTQSAFTDFLKTKGVCIFTP